MEKDSNTILVHSNVQLYHIFKTDSFTYCLICLEDIKSTSANVKKHLISKNHAESIQCMFKACNPGLIDDIEDERYLDIVSKSVFDISVLLGKETCYVTKQGGFWFCLMCEQNVSENYLDDAIVKHNITGHLLSASHIKKVKEVCFLYRLNATQDFLLLNKSVVYCSICKDVMQCTEADLLKTAIIHLEIMQHPQCTTSNAFQCEKSYFVKNEELKAIEQGWTDIRVPDDNSHQSTIKIVSIPKTEFGGEVKNENSGELSMNGENNSMSNLVPNQKSIDTFDEKKFWKENHCFICLQCRRIVTLSEKKGVLFVIDNHFGSFHEDLYVKKPIDYIKSLVVFINGIHKKQVSSLGKIGKFVKRLITRSGLQIYLKYILKSRSTYFCVICMVSMPSCLDNTELIKSLTNHFNSFTHKQCEIKRQKLNQAFQIDQCNRAAVEMMRNRKAFVTKQLQMKKDKKKRKLNLKKIKLASKINQTDKDLVRNMKIIIKNSYKRRRLREK